MQDSNTEISIVLIAVLIIFFVFIGVGVYFVFLHQKKKYQHAKDLIQVQESLQREIYKAQIEIQEQTFNHISQEIHDNVGQVLSLAKVQINIMNENDKTDREMLNEVKQHIGTALTDLRDIAKSLNSDRIRGTNIHAAVKTEMERISKSGFINANVRMLGEERSLNDQQNLILFRIIQESLQNILKHAAASEVLITFHYGVHDLNVSILDNGKGFDPVSVLNKPAGLGLTNIRNRAALAGGSSSFESSPNQGTTIKIHIPYA